jgi:CRISPR-associated protein Cas2
MFTVISYDIPDDRRRLKVAKVLEGHGDRVQRSVFEAHLTQAQYDKLQQRLRRLLKEDEDNVRFYRLCADCQLLIETIGQVGVTPEPGLLII